MRAPVFPLTCYDVYEGLGVKHINLFEMKNFILLLLTVALTTVMVTSSGCARSCQRWEANGSIVGSVRGDWVVVKESGGVITDVYLLHNVMVQSEETSDGWLFIDQAGNPVHIGGDMKAIRVTGDHSLFDKYVEYHIEFDPMTYQEKLLINQRAPGIVVTHQ